MPRKTLLLMRQLLLIMFLRKTQLRDILWTSQIKLPLLNCHRGCRNLKSKKFKIIKNTLICQLILSLDKSISLILLDLMLLIILKLKKSRNKLINLFIKKLKQLDSKIYYLKKKERPFKQKHTKKSLQKAISTLKLMRIR